MIENTRNKVRDDDFDTLTDPTGQYIVLCAKVCEKTADGEASLRRWLSEKRKQEQRWEPRAYRFTMAGAPAVRLIYLLPDSAEVITRMSVAYQGRRYTINCVAPAATGLDYLPPPVAGLLGTLEFLSDKNPQATWGRYSVGDVRLGIPPGWVARRGPLPPGIEAMWVGGTDLAGASFLVARTAGRTEMVGRLFPVEKSKRFKVAGHPTTVFYGKWQQPAGAAAVIVFDQSGRDGRRLAFVCVAREDKWSRAEPFFERILKTVEPGASATGAALPPELIPRPFGRIFSLPCPEYFKGDLDYTFTAYQNGVVVRDNRSGEEETVLTDRPGHAVPPSFQGSIDNNPGLAAKLGAALCDRIPVLDDSVRVQIFSGGMMVEETAYGANWWRYHAPR